jgi:hypothetical protein
VTLNDEGWLATLIEFKTKEEKSEKITCFQVKMDK